MPTYSKKKYQGKIAWCPNKYLSGVMPTGAKDGHYVYIRQIDKNGLCKVSTFVSLEDSTGKLKASNVVRVRNGELYSLPLFDSRFPRWTGLNKNVHTVHISRMRNVGIKTVKRRHHFMMAKHK